MLSLLKKIKNKFLFYYVGLLKTILKQIQILYFYLKGNNYNIKRGYVERTQYNYFDDTRNKDEYQNEVYQKALQFAIHNGLKIIVDYGCGSGYKLIKYFNEYETIGIDVAQTVSFLKETYPNKTWIASSELGNERLKVDLIICADVIEHYLKPEELLSTIKNNFEAKYYIFSTVNRDILRGIKDWGPPKNIYHIREWNGKEFISYMSKYFQVLHQEMTNQKQATQMIICKNISDEK